MKKVLKLSSLLAAVLLLTVLAGVQLLTAQVATTIAVDNTYVSNGTDAGIDNTFRVTVTYAPTGEWLPEATTTVTVKNNTTDEETSAYTLKANASSTPNIWLLDITVTAATSSLADQTSGADDGAEAATGTVHGVDGDELVVSLGPPVVFAPSRIVTVDTKGPAISDISPVHDLRTMGGTLIFRATLTDAGVGLGSDAATVVAATTLSIESGVVSVTATKPADNQSTVSAVLAVPPGKLTWDIKARDTLGNEAQSVAVAEDETTDAEEFVQRHIVVIDILPPSIDSAKTGREIDTSGDRAAYDDSGSRTAVAVTFDDGGEAGGGLNGTTIDDSDFRVDVDGQPQAISSVVWNSDLPLMVFITLGSDLEGDATPTVRLVGPIQDIAGNSTGTGQEVAEDGINPTLTVSVDGSADTVTNDALTVLVSADEKSRNPSRTSGITVSEITQDDDGNDIVGDAASIRASKFRTVTSNEQWEWTFSLANATNGTYNVCINVNDISGSTGNVGEAGTCAAGAAIDADESITFTVDTAVADPTVTPEATDNAGAFIEIDYGETITALTATVAGDAVDPQTLDDKSFTIAPPADGYEIGEYEVAVTATDTAGNTKTTKAMVEITARAAFKINLRPGYNLISLPGTPESTDINDVIGADHSINQVLTYSPFVEGGWLSAERGDDGAFAGTLTEIDGSTAYIVRTTSFEPLEVSIPRLQLGNVLPPQTNLGVGWNLVPVIDLSSEEASGGVIADYFQGIGDAILTIDQSGRLAAIDSDDGVVGKGYWVYASRAAVLLPTRR